MDGILSRGGELSEAVNHRERKLKSGGVSCFRDYYLERGEKRREVSLQGEDCGQLVTMDNGKWSVVSGSSVVVPNARTR